MAELPSNPNSANENTNRGSTPNTPRWVKVFGVIFIGLVLVFVIVHLTGRGHGFGSHTSTSTVAEHGTQQP
jgi:hypothetical protein